MKILVVNYEFPPLGGGGGVIAAHIAEELAPEHEIHVLTTGRQGLPRFELVNGIRIYRVPVLGRSDEATASLFSLLCFPLSSTLKGIQLFWRNHYDLIHTHFAVPSGITGVILSRLFRRPNVLSVHGGDVYDPSKTLSPHKNRLLKRVVESVLNLSDRVVAQSTDVKDRITTHYKVKKQIDIIPLGLKKPSFEKRSRSELGISQEDFVIMTIGRLVKRKGLECLLQAVTKAANPRIRILIAGEGPEKGQLEFLAQQLGIGDRVDFLGTILEDRKFNLLSASNAFVLCSLHEGFGIVYLEAMYSGLPVIAADVGGQTDFLADGETGFLVPPEDSACLADRILSLLDNADLRKAFGENNRKRVRDYSIVATAQMYEMLFQEMLKRAGSAAH